MIAATYDTARARKRRISTLVLRLRAGFGRKAGRKARSGPLGVLRILRPRVAATPLRCAGAFAR